MIIYHFNMKTLNKIACITFGAIAFLAICVAVYSARIDYLAIAFACGCISVTAFKDIKNP